MKLAEERKKIIDISNKLIGLGLIQDGHFLGAIARERIQRARHDETLENAPVPGA